MPPEVVFTLAILFIAFPAVLFRGIARVRQAGSNAKGRGGDILRTSELRTMIADAVEEATEPLRRRIEQLEEIEVSRNDDVRLLDAMPLHDAREGERPSARVRA